MKELPTWKVSLPAGNTLIAAGQTKSEARADAKRKLSAKLPPGTKLERIS